jgi:type IV pilus assembly protein PilV
MNPPDSARPDRTRVRGFTLIEVMVALFVTAVGLLGIAKIQALAYASTGTASVRSLIALEAAGLAASMHANRSYWAAGSAPIPITITGTTITGGSLNTEGVPISAGGPGLPISPVMGYCQQGSGNTPCSTAELVAASDLHTYATALNGLLNNSSPTTTITCPVVPGAPINCVIQVSWNEKAVSISSQSATATTECSSASAADTCQFNPTYTLYVEP